MSNPLVDLLKDLTETERLRERESMSMAAVAEFVHGGHRLRHTGKRHDAQVDAMLRVKYEQCGYPDAYQPPEADDDMAGSTFINCRIVGDEAINSLSEVAQSMVDGDDDEKKKPDEGTGQPVEPSPAQPTNGKRDSTLAKAALLGASLIGAGGAGALLTQWLTPSSSLDPSVYSVQAIPYEPAGPTQ